MLAICCYVTSYPKFSSLKQQILSHTIFEGLESRSGLTGWLWFTVPHEATLVKLFSGATAISRLCFQAHSCTRNYWQPSQFLNSYWSEAQFLIMWAFPTSLPPERVIQEVRKHPRTAATVSSIT